MSKSNYEELIIEKHKTSKVLSQTPITELYTALVGCAAKLGVPVAPTFEQTKIYQQVLSIGFPHITVAELEIACTMNVTRSLEKHVQCFGELTTDNLCAILSLYKDFRGKTIVRHRTSIDSSNLLPQNKPQEVSESDWLAIIEKDREHLKAGRDTWKLGAVRVMKWLMATGRVDDNTFTDAQINQMRTIAKEEVMKRERISQRKVVEMVKTDRDKFDQMCINELQTIAYYQYLTRL